MFRKHSFQFILFALLLLPHLVNAQYIHGDPDSLPTVSPSNTITIPIAKYEKSCHNFSIITRDTLLNGKAYFINGNLTHSDFALAVPSGNEVHIFPVMNDTLEKNGITFCDTIDFTGDSVNDLMITWHESFHYGGPDDFIEGYNTMTYVEIWDAEHGTNVLTLEQSMCSIGQNYEYGTSHNYCAPDFTMTFEHSELLIVDRNFSTNSASFKVDGWKRFTYSNGKFRKVKS